MNDQDSIQEVQKLLGKGAFNQAFKLCNYLLQKDEKDAALWFFKGKALSAMNRESEATYCYQRSREINPSGLSFLNLLRSLSSITETGQTKKIQRRYIDPKSISPKVLFADEESWTMEGSSYQQMGMYEEALACYENALRKKPSYPQAVQNKKKLLEMLGWEDLDSQTLFRREVLSKLDSVSRNVVENLSSTIGLGVQLEQEIRELPITSYDRKISITIKNSHITGLGFFNCVDHIPKPIGALSHLEVLYCQGGMIHNRITEIPPSLADLKNLKILNLDRNKLNSLPDWIGELTGLEKVYLEYNKLTSLPYSLCELHNIAILKVRHNELQSLPSCLGKLPELWLLDVGFNKLTTLPESLQHLPKLQYLKVNNNNYDRIPAFLEELRNRNISIEIENTYF